MNNTIRTGMLAGLSCLAAALTLLPVSNVMAEDIIEEIVVTGSYIKRDSFDSSSPITIVDQASIAANATPNLGEVLVAQTFNYGTDFQANTYSARFQLGNISQANLRGLGAGATLDLIDGKRTNNPFLSNSLPQIAIKRIDILKDGASALYGTDAVAGVVNLITRKNFTGITMSLFHTEDKAGDFDEQQFEFLAGSATDNGHITFAGRYATRSALEQVDRPIYLRQGFERSGTGNPGDWLVPVRDGTGAMVDQNPLLPGIQGSRQVDPGCGAFNGPGGTDVGSKMNYISGDRNSSGTNCRLHFGEWWNFMNPQDQYSVWMNYRYDFSDTIHNVLEITYSRLETESRGSIQNPGGRTEEFPIVPGDHPGNPFRAFGDANANGILDQGEQLYAMDANGDGIPDRGTLDLNGDGLMDVLLHSDPFNPNGGGIAFNEDVDVIALRAMGKLGTRATPINSDSSNSGNATFDQTDFRIVNTLTIEFPRNDWELQLGIVWEKWDWVFSQKNTSQSALINGLNGSLKTDPTLDVTSFWNPFATQQLACVDRVCSETGTPDFVNTQGVMDAINITANDVEVFEFFSFSAIVTGDIYELPAGTMAAAFGIEYRKDERDTDLNSQQNRCDWHEGGCGFDWNESQDVNSVFYELIIPVLSEGAAGDLEVQLAGRYVDYGGNIGSDFNPKFAGLWQPSDWLSIRGSWSSAFIAPTLEDQFEPEDCGLQTANDPITGDSSNSFRVACVGGNPDLKPEEADVWNIGFSVSLFDGDLTIGIDYSVFDFTDRIAETALNNVITQDFNNFVAAGLTPANPVDVQTWLNSPASDPAIIRDITGVITRVLTTRLNATKMEHRAFDFYSRYHLNLSSWGSFIFDLNATLVDEYSYDLGPGLPSGDAAGSQNEQLIDIPPIPELRVTGTINWTLNNHSAMLRVRWIDEFDLSFNSSALFGGQLFFNGTDKADDIFYTDVKYAYTFTDLLGNDLETTLEIGGRNIFDEFPEPQFNLGGLETFVHDIRGAMWYVRINQDI